jgi:hypothetical protein
MAILKLKKDWKWYLAEIEWYENIYAYWETENEAKKELLWVLEMTIDYNSELTKKQKEIKTQILKSKDFSYAI